MDVTLLYFEDCPNWLEASAHLETLAGENSDLHITHHIVDTLEEAERTGFRGSPSILLDGADLFAKPDDPVGLACRVYQTPSGSAGSPTLSQLQEAIASTRRRSSPEQHWNVVYQRRPSSELGWYEPEPSTLTLLTGCSAPGDSVIDVGGGDSRLVDGLLSRGYDDVTVLDLSRSAIELARTRLGSVADVHWVHADITDFTPSRTWDLWHDRAVFHFLVTEEQRTGYRESTLKAIVPGGILIVATFNMDGPQECAGLPVQRYDTESLPAAMAPEFELVTVVDLPRGLEIESDQRPYIGAVFKRATLAPAGNNTDQR